uniref:Transposable element P transposase-like RNase H domain-containing protein n=1 Tax=Anguilla anguilla TaxID=7936 RepID=A0A0E9UE50_ANGAN
MRCIYISQMDFSSNQIHYYVDFGTGEIDRIVVTETMVLMVVSINESWPGKSPLPASS